MALKGGPNGYESFISLMPSARTVIKKTGLIVFEVGFDQAQIVKNILNQNKFKVTKVVKDLAGIERILIAKPI